VGYDRDALTFVVVVDSAVQAGWYARSAAFVKPGPLGRTARPGKPPSWLPLKSLLWLPFDFQERIEVSAGLKAEH